MLKGLLDLTSQVDAEEFNGSGAADSAAMGAEAMSAGKAKVIPAGRTARKRFCKYLGCDPNSPDPVGIANSETGPALPCGKVAAMT